MGPTRIERNLSVFPSCLFFLVFSFNSLSVVLLQPFLILFYPLWTKTFSFRTCPCSVNYFYQFHLSLFPF